MARQNQGPRGPKTTVFFNLLEVGPTSLKAEVAAYLDSDPAGQIPLSFSKDGVPEPGIVQTENSGKVHHIFAFPESARPAKVAVEAQFPSGGVRRELVVPQNPTTQTKNTAVGYYMEIEDTKLEEGHYRLNISIYENSKKKVGVVGNIRIVASAPVKLDNKDYKTGNPIELEVPTISLNVELTFTARVVEIDIFLLEADVKEQLRLYCRQKAKLGPKPPLKRGFWANLSYGMNNKGSEEENADN